MIIAHIMEECDIAVITETWGPVSDFDKCSVINCVKKNTTRMSGPTCGGVAIVYHKHIPYRHNINISTKYLQAIAGRVAGVTIVGCYIPPKKLREISATSLHWQMSYYKDLAS